MGCSSPMHGYRTFFLGYFKLSLLYADQFCVLLCKSLPMTNKDTAKSSKGLSPTVLSDCLVSLGGIQGKKTNPKHLGLSAIQCEKLLISFQKRLLSTKKDLCLLLIYFPPPPSAINLQKHGHHLCRWACVPLSDPFSAHFSFCNRLTILAFESNTQIWTFVVSRKVLGKMRMCAKDFCSWRKYQYTRNSLDGIWILKAFHKQCFTAVFLWCL